MNKNIRKFTHPIQPVLRAGTILYYEVAVGVKAYGNVGVLQEVLPNTDAILLTLEMDFVSFRSNDIY